MSEQSSRHSEQLQRQMSRLMQGFSVETTPRGAAKLDDFRLYLRPDTKVYATCLPGDALAQTLDTCAQLAKQGMHPVPHFTARGIHDLQELEEGLARLTGETQSREVLALAGADKQPAGCFPDTMTMLETGLFEKYGIQSIGVAGHPEGSPDFGLPEQREFGLRKAEFARATGLHMYLITQFVFEADPIYEWVDRVRNSGNQLPIVVGVPGVASLKSLIGHARNCGIGASMTFLTKQASKLHNLLKLQAPDKLVMDLAAYADAHPEAGIAGVHMYPLGGMAPTAEWSYAAAEGNINIPAD